MNSKTRIKICGLTQLTDALHVAALGGDAIGLVFHAQSPRAVDIATARKIRWAMPPFVTVTALFMDEAEAWVSQVVEQVNPDCLQFHGVETQAFCAQWQKPYLKSIPMGSTSDVHEFVSRYADAQGFLLDSNVAGRQGGSGDTFDWSTIPSPINFPLILAGGLTPENVAQAIIQVKPWGVDVSSGVEKSRGKKDLALISQFFQEVKRADANA